MKRLFLTFTVIFFVIFKSFATEGMWLPLLLNDLNEAEMKSLGMKMTAEDIYSVNHGSLKDAIVHFGGFCTAEVISNQGLLLTNHHCGYGEIQSHSSLTNNYIENGFWANSLDDELANPGLFATFIVMIDDVTKKCLAGVSDDMTEEERQSQIDKNMEAIKSGFTLKAFEKVMIKPFFKGNQYFLFLTETYNDVRLVGAPPSSIGKFGADTDNWVWPRHTGDFSLFRIYANKDNEPAEYAEDNVPYHPKHSLPISIDGVEEDDFTLIFGFPGRTNEYLPATAIDLQANTINPIRISIRDQSLDVLNKAMRADPTARIQYAAKQARIANGWKKWKGESLGIKTSNAIQKRRMMEQEFQSRVDKKRKWRKKYGQLIADFEKNYLAIAPYARSREYIFEITRRNNELLNLASIFKSYQKMYESGGLKGIEARLPRLINYLEGYYKDFSPSVDQDIFARLLKIYDQALPAEHQASFVKSEIAFAQKDYNDIARKVYLQSIISKGSSVLKLLKDDPAKFFDSIKGDYGFQFLKSMTDVAEKMVFTPYNEIQQKLNKLQRIYMKALMEVFPERRFYPDANSTMRVTYGQVKSYEPRDALHYKPVTYLDGVMEKYTPGDYEFDVPAKLRALYDKKDFGPYKDKNGKMPVCFLGSNHTTGGNSGSPTIDAYGNLVGLNFDRVWEGTMSDINYDPNICRNIMVDIRYVLFLIDKYAGATRLIDEMNLVHPKG